MKNPSTVTREEIIQLYREAIVYGVPLDQVQKKIQKIASVVDDVGEVHSRSLRVITKKKRQKRILPVVLVTLGSVLMANAIWPILSYAMFTSPQLQRINLVSPLPQSELIEYSSSYSVQAPTLSTGKIQPKITPIMIKESLDYTNLANWFSTIDIQDTQLAESAVYTIDIPSLNIEQAEVKIGGTDLNENLIQYPGTAMPGEIGAPVVFGHSVLRQFYRPEIDNPRRYKSIFSKIMTMKVGDEIFVTYQGVKYTFQVQEKHEVQPEDLFILQQRHDTKQLKLVTCVPEGTYLRRGVVVAQLVAAGE